VLIHNQTRVFWIAKHKTPSKLAGWGVMTPCNGDVFNEAAIGAMGVKTVIEKVVSYWKMTRNISLFVKKSRELFSFQ
jgi:hypothetical protein